jgi:hypothetical protein
MAPNKLQGWVCRTPHICLTCPASLGCALTDCPTLAAAALPLALHWTAAGPSSTCPHLGHQPVQVWAAWAQHTAARAASARPATTHAKTAQHGGGGEVDTASAERHSPTKPRRSKYVSASTGPAGYLKQNVTQQYQPQSASAANIAQLHHG